MATTPNDPSIAAAAAIAEAMGEKLIVVELTTPAGHAWLSTHRAGAPAADIDGLPPDLHGLGERLAVLSRGAAQDRLALAIAAARGVPTLSIDSREEKEEEEEGRSRRRRPRAADQSSVSR
jgi:hypothetical protein